MPKIGGFTSFISSGRTLGSSSAWQWALITRKLLPTFQLRSIVRVASHDARYSRLFLRQKRPSGWISLDFAPISSSTLPVLGSSVPVGIRVEAWVIAGHPAVKVNFKACPVTVTTIAHYLQGRSKDGLYEPALADSEREAVADLLTYLENVGFAIRSCSCESCSDKEYSEERPISSRASPSGL